MTKILPSVIIIFTIQCLTCVSNTLEDNIASKNDYSPKDSAEITSTSSKNLSSGRIIRPSAWSKEEKELRRSDGRYNDNEDEDLLLSDEQFSLLNIKKFFRYLTSLLYDVDENNDGSLKKITDNVIVKIQNLTHSGLSMKSKNNVNDERQSFEKGDAADKSANDKKFQNILTSGITNKLSDGGKMQNLSNDGFFNGRQSAKTPKFETLNLAEAQNNQEMQNSLSNNPSNKPSNDKNAQESSHNIQPTEESILESQNSKDKKFTKKPKNDMKTQTHYIVSTSTPDNDEVQNSVIDKGSSKSSNDKHGQESSPTETFSNKQPKENSKQKTQNLVNTDTQDNEKMQKSPSNNTSNKPPININSQKSSDNDSSNYKHLTRSPELETQNSNDKDSTNNSENSMKSETQNPSESNTPSKAAIEEEMENFLINDSLNKPSGKLKMQNSSNNSSLNSQQPIKNQEGNLQNPINKDDFNIAVQDKKMQNSSIDNKPLKSIPASKNDKPKEDLTETAVKDYDECKVEEVTLNNNTIKYIPEDKEEKYEDNDNEEEEEIDDSDENDANENETENDYISGGTDINDNDIEENNVEDGNENVMNGDDVDDGNINGNTYDGDENKSDTGNQNPQPAVILGKKDDDNTPIILPKFIIQAIQDQQNFSETQPSKNQIDNKDNVLPESVTSQNVTNEENPSPEFQLSSNEFMDDYINNLRKENSQKENEQASNVEEFNPIESAAINKENLLPIPIFLSKFKKNYAPQNAALPISKTMKHQNLPFHQSQNTGDNFWSEKITRPFPIFNEGRKVASRNQGLLDEAFPQNVPHTFTLNDKPIFATQENLRSEEVIPQKSIPFQQTPYFRDLQDIIAAPQNDYNTFTQPETLGFQDNSPSVKTFHSDVPARNEYTPEIIGSFQILPNRPVPLQNEGYLKHHHGNYNFQEKKTPDINKGNNQHFEQEQTTVLHPSMFSSTQYISNQNTPDELGKISYFTNYKPGKPENTPNEKIPESHTELFSNHMMSDVLQPNPLFNQMHNQDSSLTGAENNIDKNMSQDQLDARKPQNQTHNVRTLNQQNESENQPLQNNFTGDQIPFPHTVKSLQRNKVKKILLDKSQISSDRFPAQNETETAKLMLSQNNTKISKEVRPRLFNIAENNLQINSENQDIPSVISENITPKSQSPQVKVSRPLNDEQQKSSTFNQTEDEEELLNLVSNTGKTEIENDYLSVNNYDSEDKTNEDENQDSEEEEDYEIEDDDVDDNQIEDDYINENNFDSDDNENEDEDEEEDEDENEEEEKEKNYHDKTETSRINNPQRTVINEKTGSRIISPNFVNQVESEQQNHFVTPTSHDNINSAAPKPQGMANKENPSSVSEISNSEFIDNYNNDRLVHKPVNEKEITNLSGGAVTDATMQITQNPTYDTNDLTQSSENSKSESAFSNPGRSFDTILEYIYNFSNNSLFKGIREENNSM